MPCTHILENPVVWRQKTRLLSKPSSVHEKTEVQRRKVMCPNSHSQLKSSNEVPEW